LMKRMAIPPAVAVAFVSFPDLDCSSDDGDSMARVEVTVLVVEVGAVGVCRAPLEAVATSVAGRYGKGPEGVHQNPALRLLTTFGK